MEGGRGQVFSSNTSIIEFKWLRHNRFHYLPECDKCIAGNVLNHIVGQVQAGEDPEGPKGFHWNLSQGIVC